MIQDVFHNHTVTPRGQMPRLNVSTNVHLYYRVHGSGPHKLLFINGLGSISQQWDHQVSYFSSHDGYEICVFDNRGSGQSSVPDLYYS